MENYSFHLVVTNNCLVYNDNCKYLRANTFYLFPQQSLGEKNQTKPKPLCLVPFKTYKVSSPALMCVRLLPNLHHHIGGGKR